MSKNASTWIGVLVVAGVAGFAGHWWGTRHAAPAAAATATDSQTASTPKERKIRFYRNPMGLADTSPVPKKTAWAWITSRCMRARRKTPPPMPVS